MIHGTIDKVRYIPTFMGNDKDENPAYVDILVMSAEAQEALALDPDDKARTDNGLFKFCVKGFKGITDAEGNELKDADDIVKTAGLNGLVKEVVKKFVDINTFGGESKNESEPSTV